MSPLFFLSKSFSFKMENEVKTMSEKRLTIFGICSFISFVILKVSFDIIDSLQYVQMLLVFAYGVLIPLGLQFAHTRRTKLYLSVLNLHPIALLLAIGSFFVTPGILSTILSLPWFLFTALISLYGLWSFFYHKIWTRLHETVIHAGMIYIVIGGGWLVLHRTGSSILHFDGIIILLTSIHFHYAAFVTLIAFGVIGREMHFSNKGIKSLFQLLSIFLLVGPIFVAVGITFGADYPWIEFVAVTEFVVPIAILSLLTLLFFVPTLPKALSKILITIACLSLFVSMTFAFLYGYEGIGSLQFLLNIPLMVFVHGMVNAFGFSLCMFSGLYIYLYQDSPHSTV
ncbi:hypothetical protein GLW08_12535 [Pontibacillus yanchengensis]|uniref:Uncharacterized protein n=1 Tax=Pontibacillus yanchengensis TaxID=462910 RepID=A0ACC7VHS0_9BACI|nr:hypothetical protein [Pontibacillus yanchengensis]